MGGSSNYCKAEVSCEVQSARFSDVHCLQRFLTLRVQFVKILTSTCMTMKKTLLLNEEVIGDVAEFSICRM